MRILIIFWFLIYCLFRSFLVAYIKMMCVYSLYFGVKLSFVGGKLHSLGSNLVSGDEAKCIFINDFK